MTNSWVSIATAAPWKAPAIQKRPISRSKDENNKLIRATIESGINRPCDVARELGIHEATACRLMRRIGYHRIPITKAGTPPVKIRAIYADGSSKIYPSQVAAAKAHGLNPPWIGKLSLTGRTTKKGIKFERVDQ